MRDSIRDLQHQARGQKLVNPHSDGGKIKPIHHLPGHAFTHRQTHYSALPPDFVQSPFDFALRACYLY